MNRKFWSLKILLCRVDSQISNTALINDQRVNFTFFSFRVILRRKLFIGNSHRNLGFPIETHSQSHISGNCGNNALAQIFIPFSKFAGRVGTSIEISIAGSSLALMSWLTALCTTTELTIDFIWKMRGKWEFPHINIMTLRKYNIWDVSHEISWNMFSFQKSSLFKLT